MADNTPMTVADLTRDERIALETHRLFSEAQEIYGMEPPAPTLDEIEHRLRAPLIAIFRTNHARQFMAGSAKNPKRRR